MIFYDHKFYLTQLVPYGTIQSKEGGNYLNVDTKGGMLITQIKQISARIFERLLVNAGIEEFNGAQGRILYVLWKEDGVAIVELSKRTGLAKTSLTSMLERMEKANLIQRIPDKQDKRKLCISLTEQARNLSKQYDEVSDQMNHIFYDGFHDEEILALDAALQRVLDNLTKATVNSKEEHTE